MIKDIEVLPISQQQGRPLFNIENVPAETGMMVQEVFRSREEKCAFQWDRILSLLNVSWPGSLSQASRPESAAQWTSGPQTEHPSLYLKFLPVVVITNRPCFTPRRLNN
jgi:hypothetical protein